MTNVSLFFFFFFFFGEINVVPRRGPGWIFEKKMQAEECQNASGPARFDALIYDGLLVFDDLFESLDFRD